MDEHINSEVKQCLLLTLQVNKGERHRIMHSGVRRGSLWVTPRVNYYCVALSGKEIEALLYNFLRRNFGDENGVDQDRKYWNISDIGNVTKVIRRFGEP